MFDRAKFLIILPCLVLPILATSISGNAREMSWHQCVDFALKNNADIKIAQSNVEVQEENLKGSGSGYYPQISGSLSATESKSGSTTNSKTSNGSSTSYEASLRANQNLFAGFYDLSKINLAQIKLKSAKAELRLAESKLALDLKTAYENLKFAIENQELTQNILLRRQENLKLVQLSYQGGHDNKGSVLVSEAYLKQTQYEKIQANNQVRIAEREFKKLLGLDKSEMITLTDSIPLHDPENSPQFEALVTQHPTYWIAQYAEEGGNEQISQSHSAFWPTLNLSGSLSRDGSQFFPDQDRWSVGLNLNLPLFDGFKDYHASRADQKNWQQLQIKSSLSSRTLIVEMDKQYSEFIEAIAKLEADESFKSAAEVRAQIARAKYNNGIMKFEDWDMIENDLINRQRISLQSKKNRTIAEANWQNALGKGVTP